MIPRKQNSDGVTTLEPSPNALRATVGLGSHNVVPDTAHQIPSLMTRSKNTSVLWKLMPVSTPPVVLFTNVKVPGPLGISSDLR